MNNGEQNLKKFGVYFSDRNYVEISADGHFVGDEGELVFVKDTMCVGCSEPDAEYPAIFVANAWQAVVEIKQGG